MEYTGLNILLVDDDEFFASVVASQLQEEYRHKTTVASNGRHAREIVQANGIHFDVILSDYDMPEMNGLDFLRWLKESGNESPVIMITAAGSEIVAVEAMKLGAYDYVRKEQLDLQHLGVVINATYERRQFRISQLVEEERVKEIGLNQIATDKVRDVLNAITPMLNNALANINSDIEIRAERILGKLPSEERVAMREILEQIQKDTATLEAGIKGLLGLYRMLYAHHAEAQEIDHLRKDLEDKTLAQRK